ncbi:MAG: DUF1573 domain-containing protein [Bacteroidales bacterium]|nr:DUF1573 domain-containing protein [Bacteroidales bacterium]
MNRYKIISILSIAVLSFILASCSNKDKDNIDISVVENQAAIKFENDILNFHSINEGEKVTGSFKFKNVGDHDLVISDVQVNCGCTVADYPHNAIKPGKEGLISVSYDSKGAKGMRIEKNVTVYSNTKPSATVLKIVAEVE